MSKTQINPAHKENEICSLHQAIELYKNDENKLIRYIQENAERLNLEEKNSKGQTPLQCLILLAKTKCIELLIDSGADINAIDDNGDSCWHCIAQCQDQEECEEIVQIFSQERPAVSINLQNKAKETPIYQLVESNNIDALESFLKYGANIFIENSEEEDAWRLSQKLERERKSISQETEDAESDFSETCYEMLSKLVEEISLISQSLGNADLKAIRKFTEGNFINCAISADDDTMLHEVARRGTVEQAILLLEKGANLYAKNSQGEAPIDVAAPVLNKFLLEEKNRHEEIIAAIKANGLGEVEGLMAEGITMKEILDAEGNTALHIAASNNRPRMVKFFIQKGASITDNNTNFTTAEILAEEKHGDIQADLENARVAEKDTAKLEKELQDINKVINAFEQEKTRMQAFNHSFYRMAAAGDIKAIDEIIERELYNEVCDARGNTIMHILARQGTMLKVGRVDEEKPEYALKKIFLNCGRAMNLNARNSDGKTVIECAREGGFDALADYIEFQIRKASFPRPPEKDKSKRRKVKTEVAAEGLMPQASTTSASSVQLYSEEIKPVGRGGGN